jgi:long-subunit fatty acid transport protein
MVKLEGLNLNVGAAAIIPRWEYVPVDGDSSGKVKSKSMVSYPPALSMTYNFGDPGIGPLAAGVGVYITHGSAFAWPKKWVGRQEVQKLDLRVFEITPVIAWQPHDKFAIGGGLRVMPSTVMMQRAVGFGSELDGDVELAGDALGFGGAVGVSFFPMKGLSLALNWRTNADLNFEGDADFNFPPPFDTQAYDRTVKTFLKIPQEVVFGTAYEVLPDQLILVLDLAYSGWSAYDELAIEMVSEDGTSEVSVSRKDSRDVFWFKTGIEYKFGKVAALRAGYLYEPYTVPEKNVDPAPPDSTTHVVALGGSYYVSNFGIHAHALTALFAPREALKSHLPAEWRGGMPGASKAWIFGLSVSAKFDVGPAFTSPATAAASSKPAETEPAAAATASAEAAPVEATAATGTPVEATAVTGTPVEATTVTATPVEATAVETTSTDAAPTEIEATPVSDSGSGE